MLRYCRNPEYAREELRAEISAMMTGERVGVGHGPKRGAAYVEHWVRGSKKTRKRFTALLLKPSA